MEDLDPKRCRHEFEREILLDLEWLGLDWDGPVLRQSEQFPRYQEVLADLASRDLTYACRCSRGDIRLVLAPHPGEGLRYPGTCRELGLDTATDGKSYGQRLKVQAGSVLLHDRLQAPLEVEIAQECGDFLLWTKAGLPSYQFAVTLDDHYQGITEVVRGRDLLPSTARQNLLRQHLNYPNPSTVHMGLILDRQGQRLAKRTGASSIAGFREAGGQAEELVSWAAEIAGLESRGPAPVDYLPDYTLPPKEDWWPSQASAGPFPLSSPQDP